MNPYQNWKYECSVKFARCTFVDLTETHGYEVCVQDGKILSTFACDFAEGVIGKWLEEILFEDEIIDKKLGGVI